MNLFFFLRLLESILWDWNFKAYFIQFKQVKALNLPSRNNYITLPSKSNKFINSILIASTKFNLSWKSICLYGETFIWKFCDVPLPTILYGFNLSKLVVRSWINTSIIWFSLHSTFPKSPACLKSAMINQNK